MGISIDGGDRVEGVIFLRNYYIELIGRWDVDEEPLDFFRFFSLSPCVMIRPTVKKENAVQTLVMCDSLHTLPRLPPIHNFSFVALSCFHVAGCCRCDRSSLANAHSWTTMAMKSSSWDITSPFRLVFILKFLRSSFGFRSLVTFLALWASFVMLYGRKQDQVRYHRYVSVIFCTITVYLSPELYSQQPLSRWSPSGGVQPHHNCRWHN